MNPIITVLNFGIALYFLGGLLGIFFGRIYFGRWYLASENKTKYRQAVISYFVISFGLFVIRAMLLAKL